MIGNTAKRLQTDYIEYPLAGIRHDFCRKQPSFAKLCIQRYHLTCIGSLLENIFKRNEIAEVLNPAKRKAMAVKNEKRFLKQKRNALKNPGYSRHPVKTQASFKRLLKAV